MKCKTGDTTLFKLLVCCFISPFLLGCVTQHPSAKKQETVKSISGLKLINVFVLPFDTEFEHTWVGGLSGIDYDRMHDVYYLISDDRSHHNPARFYKAKIKLSNSGIAQVMITGVDTLFQKDGSTYPEISVNAKRTTDPEAMRLNKRTGQLVWTSEGDRVFKPMDTVLIDPTINVVDVNGRYADSIPLPENLRMQVADNGPRRNGVLEGLTFADDFRNLYVSMEEPMFQDGPQADLTVNHALTRIYKFDLKNGKNTAQYAYPLEPVAFPAPTEGGAMNNGIPDILWLGNKKLLVTERSYSVGFDGTNVKVFLADLRGADNVINIKSMRDTRPAHVIKKTLILNMDTLGIYIDNIEGATLGPVLPNGHQSVIFVADNNFSDKEKSQFMLFEIIP